ncbi:unnamed protein product [Durusdinium trenchii]|uniref:ATP-dependent DNA helicase n=1 Tax=Durusdinium trenchii TaxID=1381693 RepID=A0ABP0PH48_9DINO
MGQYNVEMLRRWRASMDLQVISDVSNASRYILGYAFKSEEDQAAARRMEAIIANLTANNDDNTLNNQQVYKAAHAALQGRTTSTFEACHLLLGYPVVQFSRDNVWIQAGPPATWTIWVPKWDELQALQQPDAYYKAKQRQRESQLPLAQFWYQEFQTSQSEEEVVVPVEGGNPVLQKWKDITFFDFCAGFKFRGCQEPIPRKRPAIVGYRNFNPDLEPEPFYYSRLLLHTVWKEPADWLQPEDDGSHAAAFQRIAADIAGHPNFLRSVCLPKLNGTVEAARKLQAVQAIMYLKASSDLMASSSRDGFVHTRAAEQNYKDSLLIMEALKARNDGEEFDFQAPETIPTGFASNAFAPVDGGDEAFEMLTVENPSEDVLKQRHAMECIIQAVLAAPTAKNMASPGQQLKMLLHGPGGCGKSVVARATAHMLRQAGKGVIIAAYTGAAAWNINGVTLHSCCFLPVINESYGKGCDVPLPQGPQLAALQAIWANVTVLIVDEISFVSSFMLERLDQHLRIATGSQQMPFGGVHVVFAGDLYQLPPPKGLPCFASWLWRALELCELQGNQRAARDPSWAALLARARVGKWTANDIAELKRLVIKKKGNNRKQPAPKAVHWYATRKAVADYNREHLYVHAASNGWLRVHVSPASDVHVKSGAPVPEDLIWARPEDTGGLETLLRLAVGARVMLRHNIDVPDGLVNGACGTVAEIEVDPDSQEVVKVWVDFEKQAGSRWCAEHETTSVGIVRQPHTTMGCMRVDYAVTQEGQAYVALSRCPTKALCSLDHFNPNSLKFNMGAEWALTKLKAQQAGKHGSNLWEAVMKPPETKEFYEERLRVLKAPNFAVYGEPAKERDSWCCPKCGESTANTKAAIQKHRRQCPAKQPKAKAKPKTLQRKRPNTEARTKPKPAAVEAPASASLMEEPLNIQPYFEKQENMDLGDAHDQHMGPGGNYSIEIMLMAIRTKAMQAFNRIVWHMSDQRAFSAGDLQDALGAVQNRGGQHWVAIRCSGSNFLYMDSLQEGQGVDSVKTLPPLLQKQVPM